MSERACEAHITIELDGDRVIGELRDERGAVSRFSGWLDLISALDSLAQPVADSDRQSDRHATETNGRSRR